MIYNNILELLGNTPLVRMNKVCRGIPGEMVAKVEYFNPGQSVKDRIGKEMLDEAESQGWIQPGGTIIEGTSGNTGVGLVMQAVHRGYRCIFTTTDKQSPEKINLLKAFGAEVIVCPTAVEPDDPRSYYSVAKRLSEEIPNSYYPNQYFNAANPRTHVKTTGPEIWEGCEGKIDAFIATMGTGGTISGTGKFLKEKNPDVKIVGVDPVGSIYYDYFHSGKMVEARPYLVEGFGEDIMPSTLDWSVVDDVVQVTDKESFLMARRMAREEALFCGGSSGSAVVGALKWCREHLREGQRAVVLLPDGGARNLNKVFNDEWMRENQMLDDVGELRAEHVVARKTERSLHAVHGSTPVSEAIKLMQEREISQLPVIDDGKVVGTVREARMIDLLVHGKVNADLTVSSVMDVPLPVVSPEVRLADVSDRLMGGVPAVLVHFGDGDYDILTKFDLMHALPAPRPLASQS